MFRSIRWDGTREYNQCIRSRFLNILRSRRSDHSLESGMSLSGPFTNLTGWDGSLKVALIDSSLSSKVAPQIPSRSRREAQ
jgi:hypothetical protein